MQATFHLTKMRMARIGGMFLVAGSLILVLVTMEKFAAQETKMLVH